LIAPRERWRKMVTGIEQSVSIGARVAHREKENATRPRKKERRTRIGMGGRRGEGATIENASKRKRFETKVEKAT
jgi:hypothetical protein